MDCLPACLVHCLLLEWLSPESVWTAVRASGLLRRHVLLSSSSTSSMPRAEFRAASGEVLTDACVRWFRRHCSQRRLVLWTTVATSPGDDTICGKQKWYQNGKLHRDDDLPAVTTTDGSKMWFQHGKLHRDDDKPAVCDFREIRELWYKNGELHRDGDLPAEIWKNGIKLWYQNGKCHRDDDLPAVIWSDGREEEWYQNGECHRDDNKPAVVRANGWKEWYHRDTLLRGGW